MMLCHYQHEPLICFALFALRIDSEKVAAEIQPDFIVNLFVSQGLYFIGFRSLHVVDDFIDISSESIFDPKKVVLPICVSDPLDSEDPIVMKLPVCARVSLFPEEGEFVLSAHVSMEDIIDCIPSVFGTVTCNEPFAVFRMRDDSIEPQGKTKNGYEVAKKSVDEDERCFITAESVRFMLHYSSLKREVEDKVAHYKKIYPKDKVIRDANVKRELNRLIMPVSTICEKQTRRAYDFCKKFSHFSEEDLLSMENDELQKLFRSFHFRNKGHLRRVQEDEKKEDEARILRKQKIDISRELNRVNKADDYFRFGDRENIVRKNVKVRDVKGVKTSFVKYVGDQPKNSNWKEKIEKSKFSEKLLQVDQVKAEKKAEKAQKAAADKAAKTARQQARPGGKRTEKEWLAHTKQTIDPQMMSQIFEGFGFEDEKETKEDTVSQVVESQVAESDGRSFYPTAPMLINGFRMAHDQMIDYLPASMSKDFVLGQGNSLNVRVHEFKKQYPGILSEDFGMNDIDDDEKWCEQIEGLICDMKFAVHNYLNSMVAGSNAEVKNIVQRAYSTIKSFPDIDTARVKEKLERFIAVHSKNAKRKMEQAIIDLEREMSIVKDKVSQSTENVKATVSGVPGKFSEWIKNLFPSSDNILHYKFPFMNMTVLDFFETLSLTIYQLNRAEGYISVYAAVRSFLGQVTNLGHATKDIASALVTAWYGPSREGRITGQSFLKNPTEIYHAVFESDLIQCIRDLFSVAFKMNVFPDQYKKYAMDSIGYIRTKMSYSEMIGMLLKSADRFLDIAEKLWNGIPWRYAIMVDSSISTIVGDAQLLVDVHDKKLVSDIMESAGEVLSTRECLLKCKRVNRVQYITELRDTLEALNNTLKNVRQSSPTDSKNIALRNQLLIIKQLHENEVKAFKRKLPLAIVLFGPPGVGKTTTIDFIVALECKYMGREYSKRICYSKAKGSEYMDDYDPDTQPIILMPEVGDESKKIAGTKGNPDLDMLTTLISTGVFTCNMAEAHMKNRVKAYPEMVILDVNQQDMNLDIVKNNPAAFYRRFLYVKCGTKALYRKKNSIENDPSIPTKDGDALRDRFEYEVLLRHAKEDGIDFEEETIMRGDIHDLHDFLLTYMDKHFSMSSDLQDKFEHDLKHGIYGAQFHKIKRDQQEQEEKKEINLAVDPQAWVLQHDFNYAKAWLQAKSHSAKEYVVDKYKRGKAAIDAKVFKAKVWWQSLTLAWENWFDIFVTYLFFNTAVFLMERNMDILRQSVFEFTETRVAIYAVMFISIFMSFPFSFTMVWFAFLFSFLLCYVNYQRLFFSLVAANLDRLRTERDQSYNKLWSANFTRFGAFRKVLGGLSCALIGAAGAYALMKPKSETTYVFADAQAAPSKFAEYAEDEIVKESFERLSDIEEKSEVSPPPVRRADKSEQKIWPNLVERDVPIYNGTCQGLTLLCKKNTYPFKVTKKGVDFCCFVLMLRGGWGVVPKHIIQSALKEGGWKMAFNTNKADQSETGWVYTEICDTTAIHLHEELYLVRLDGIAAADITKYMLNSVRDIPDITAGMRDDRKIILNRAKPRTMTDDNVLMKDILSYSADNFAGLCGTAVVGQVGSKINSFLAGTHIGAVKGTKLCFAAMLTKDIVNRGIEKFKAISPQMEILPIEDGDLIRKCEVPIPESMIYHEDNGQVVCLGKLPGPVKPNGKSKLEDTIFSGNIDFSSVDIPKTKDFAPPLMGIKKRPEYLSPYNICFRGCARPKKSLNPALCAKVQSEMEKRIWPIFEGQKLTPYSFEDAINGSPDDDFMRRMNLSTGSGHGYSGKKKKHIPRISEDPVVNAPSAEVIKEIEEFVNAAQKGESLPVIFDAALKDEPRSKEKVKAGKTRTFFQSPLTALILSKVYLGPFYTRMIEHSDVFCTALGTNMLKESGLVLRRLAKTDNDDEIEQELDEVMEGDYGAYDQTMPFGVGHSVCSVIYNTLKRAGYNQFSLNVVKSLLTSSMFPHFTILQDVFVSAGLQPSGKLSTAEDNSLRNLFLMMYYWYSHTSEDFFKHVGLGTLGDDMLSKIAKQFRHFMNNVDYGKFVEEVYGMTFTSANKEAELKPFVTFADMSFLKRKFKWSNLFKRYSGVLDSDSIYRMLEWRLPSDYTTELEQLIATVNSSLIEIFLHVDGDEEKFQFCRNQLLSCFAKRDWNVEEKIFVYNKVKKILSEDVTEFVEDEAEDNVESIDPQAGVHNAQLCVRPAGGIGVPLSCIRSQSNKIQFLKKIMEESIEALDSMGYGLETDFLELRESQMYHCNRIYRRKVQFAIKTFSLYQEAKIEYDILTSPRRYRSAIGPQSTTGEKEEGKLDSLSKLEVVHESTQDDMAIYDEDNEPRRSMKSIDEDLETFLGRPLRVLGQYINNGADVDLRIDPILLFMSNPSVRGKIKNTAFTSFTVVTIFELSSSQFHYGRAQIAGYHNPKFYDVLDLYEAIPASRKNMIRFMSSANNVAYMNPSLGETLAFKMPFVAPAPMARLYNGTSSVAAADSFDDLVERVIIYFKTLNRFKCASASPTNAYLTVHVHLEDVVFGCPTSTLMPIDPQAKKKGGDERVAGPVENMASSMAAVTGALSVIPSFAPLAVPCTAVLKGLAGMAAYFGFSKPVMINEPRRVKNEPVTNGAQTIGFETSKLISSDPKQGLTLDPNCVGTSKDEMSFAYICDREYYLGSGTWGYNTTPGSIVYKCAVHPMVTEAKDGSEIVQPSPWGYLNSAHTHSHFVLEFGIDMVTSFAHRGKWLIRYEPNINTAGVTESVNRLNTQYTFIGELGTTQMTWFCVDWCMPRAWASTPDWSDVAGLAGPSNLAYSNDLKNTLNGYWYITPLTALQSPQQDDIEFNVFVRVKEIRFNTMAEKFVRDYSQNFPIAAEELKIDGQARVHRENEASCVPLNPVGTDHHAANQEHFGETLTSVRSELKRFATCQTVTLPTHTPTSVNTLEVRMSNMPALPALNASNPWFGDKPNLLNFYRKMYLAYRGGLRNRFWLYGVPSMASYGLVRVSNFGVEDNVASDSALMITETPLARIDGSVSFVPFTNTGIEYETPFYSNNLWGYACRREPFPSTDPLMDPRSRRRHRVAVEIRGNITSGESFVVRDIAIGEDFQFLGFMGVPPIELG